MKFCCQIVATRGIKAQKVQCLQGFLAFRGLFPLDSRGGLGGNIVDDAVDVGHLIDDTDRDPVQHIVGDPGPVGGHEVRGGDAAEG